jgi:hypothetical protein
MGTQGIFLEAGTETLSIIYINVKLQRNKTQPSICYLRILISSLIPTLHTQAEGE